jgi:hypothetical protein
MLDHQQVVVNLIMVNFLGRAGDLKKIQNTKRWGSFSRVFEIRKQISLPRIAAIAMSLQGLNNLKVGFIPARR